MFNEDFFNLNFPQFKKHMGPVFYNKHASCFSQIRDQDKDGNYIISFAQFYGDAETTKKTCTLSQDYVNENLIKCKPLDKFPHAEFTGNGIFAYKAKDFDRALNINKASLKTLKDMLRNAEKKENYEIAEKIKKEIKKRQT